MYMSTRREFTSAAVIGTLCMGITNHPWAAEEMLKRRIPSSDAMLPVIGMGTSGSFQVTLGSAEYAALREVLHRFFDGGGTVIDTAPTYGNAEDVLGSLLNESGTRSRAFLATKLSRVNGRTVGLTQFNQSLKRLRTDHVELLQVHNLGDWKTQLALARELKAEGKVKYVGVTHFTDSAQDELAEVVRAAKPDFLQINYSVTQRGAEQRVFPLAKDLGVAVLANRNFNDGALFRRVSDKTLPAWAKEASATSWAQLFLKFALSHDAVTAVIPATGKPERQSDNLRAGFGPMLTAAQRTELIKIVEG